MKFSKQKLLSIMEEVNSMDVDEMAKPPKGVQDLRKDVRGNKMLHQKINLFKEPITYNEKGDAIPDAYILNPDLIEGEEFLVIPLTCEEENEFLEQNREWIESQERKYQVKFKKYEFCRQKKKTQFLPGKYRNMITAARAKRRLEKGEEPVKQMSIETKNSRIFNEIMREEFDLGSKEGSDFKKVLTKLSIPGILLKRENVDEHGFSYSNELIKFRTHTYNNFDTAEQFLNTVIRRMRGEDIENVPDEHLARQDSMLKWREDKQAVNLDRGITDKYKLRRQGYSEGTKDVSLKMIFTITGEKIGDSWNWSVTMTNKFGRKSPGEFEIKQGLEMYDLKKDGYLDDKVLRVNKEIPYPNKDFITEPIMSDISIVSSLREVISDFKEMIKSINPRAALSIANITRQDLGKNINETVNSVIKNIKNKSKWRK